VSLTNDMRPYTAVFFATLEGVLMHVK
jgi:hypothetical protein